MPKLSSKCLNNVKQYTDLRFNHFGDEYVERRIKQVVRRLKKEPKQVQDEYTAKVDEFLEINADVINQAKQSHIEQGEEGIEKMLEMHREHAIELVMKHGGNVNAALAELNGDNHKQH